MPPRIRVRPHLFLSRHAAPNTPYVCAQCRHASVATATTPAPSIDQTLTSDPPIARYPRNQLPSHKPPEFRKSQLHRQYQSLLRSSPLVVVFQHNNLQATEWMAVRRELAIALRKVDEDMAKEGSGESSVGSETRIATVQTGIFASALRVVEFWDPNFSTSEAAAKSPAATAETPQMAAKSSGDVDDPSFTHGLSRQAWKVASRRNKKIQHGLEPILSGPLALLTLPAVSPRHLKAAISILSPSRDFPAPKRRERPGYHESATQAGVQKLLLLAARVEGRVFDMDGTKWIGGIEGGIDGLRAQLVAMLQGFGGGLTNILESASRSLYLTVESRRGMLKDEETKSNPEASS